MGQAVAAVIGEDAGVEQVVRIAGLEAFDHRVSAGEIALAADCGVGVVGGVERLAGGVELGREDHRIEQDEAAEPLRRISGDLQQGVRAHRMADADGASDVRLCKEISDIAGDDPPIVNRPGARLAMSAQVDGVGGVAGECLDDRVEHPAVEPGRMGED